MLSGSRTLSTHLSVEETSDQASFPPITASISANSLHASLCLNHRSAGCFIAIAHVTSSPSPRRKNIERRRHREMSHKAHADSTCG
ncbi:hypothetical protein MUK42_29724 [Musa troglodytarum]|uniref:Uncharacterized protein n=1 Tax=Musa troglodytarum TaxID=320322 RepID=A0A9E7EZU8_9LILI|nr:hypothetical protein MUK42_29724 [Musa troglodytarum]